MGQGDEGFGWHLKYWSCLKGTHTRYEYKETPNMHLGLE
jgi:hypothetical protein